MINAYLNNNKEILPQLTEPLPGFQTEPWERGDSLNAFMVLKDSGSISLQYF